ncbi:MAG: dihydroneopterin aldolase [Gammaproteobacteria bacterium]|nr:dihydroneopterin aldolase [Gammaproteobacteria bacterium]
MNEPRRDTVFINDLRVKTIVGVWAWERVVPQIVHIDLELAADAAVAAATDNLEHTIDYHAVASRVTAFVEASTFQLIETMAEQIAGILTGEFDLPWVRVTIHKTWAVAGYRDVGIAVERGER